MASSKIANKKYVNKKVVLSYLSSGLLFGFATLSLHSYLSHAIVQGDKVGQCGHPQVVKVGGCTAGLIHPRAIATANHCGIRAGATVSFGDSSRDTKISVRTESCWSAPGNGMGSDVTFCVLERAITEIPIAPIIYGCEVDQYLTTGRSVNIVGFGKTGPNINGNTDKRWAEVELQPDKANYPGVAIVGEEGGPSPCPGDSGGPGLLRLDDTSWRTFGVVSGGTTGKSCNGEAGYPLVHPHVAAFEKSQNGIDITPCFDAETGEWDPDEYCTNFYAGDAMGEGSWDDNCGAAPVVRESFTCGMPGGSSSSSSSASSSSSSSNSSSSSASSSSTSSSSSSSSTSSSSSSGGNETNLNITAEKVSFEPAQANANTSDLTVLRFKLVSDGSGAIVEDLTIAASGELDEKEKIESVSLYYDASGTANMDFAVDLGVGFYDEDNGEITFDLSSTPLELQRGDNFFLVTYQFK